MGEGGDAGRSPVSLVGGDASLYFGAESSKFPYKTAAPGTDCFTVSCRSRYRKRPLGYLGKESFAPRNGGGGDHGGLGVLFSRRPPRPEG
jgi:hypothetical protein